MIKRISSISLLTLSLAIAAQANADSNFVSPIPGFAFGTWVYNTTWNGSGTKPWFKGKDVDGQWVNNLNCYNKAGGYIENQGTANAECMNINGGPITASQTPTPAQNQMNQIIYYGGDIEAYCGGTEQTKKDLAANGPWECSPNSFVMTYYGPYMGLYKIGDPTVDTGKIMENDLKKWEGSKPRSNSFTIHKTCDEFTSAGCATQAPAGSTMLADSPSNNFWDEYVSRDLANMGPQMGHHTTSGMRSGATYSHVKVYNKDDSISKPIMVADIDARVDLANTDDDYLDGLNNMTATQAAHLADFVAKNICNDDRISGVQFDIEPFSFVGAGGRLNGPGQAYFYEEIARDFAGYYGTQTGVAGDTSFWTPNTDGPTSANSATNFYGDSTDPLHCVDRAHPNGRFFSTFTFASKVTTKPAQVTSTSGASATVPAVTTVFTKFGNGLIVDSLYDTTTDPNIIAAAGNLENTAKSAKVTYSTTGEPGGSPTCPDSDITLNGNTYPEFQYLVAAEATAMKKVADANGLAYQFALPLGASAHEFEARLEYNTDGTPKDAIYTFQKPNNLPEGVTATGPLCTADSNDHQGAYISAAIKQINAVETGNDTNYKGVDMYGWSQQSWWTNTAATNAPYYRLMPDYPNASSLETLAKTPIAQTSQAAQAQQPNSFSRHYS